MAHTVHITEVINVPIEQVWKAIGEFNGLADFHPAIQASRIEKGDGHTVGSIRYLDLAGEGGNFVREALLHKDDETFSLKYSIIEGTLPIQNYVAGIQLKKAATDCQTTCEWWADFDVLPHADSQELIDTIGENVFRAGFQAIAMYAKP